MNVWECACMHMYIWWAQMIFSRAIVEPHTPMLCLLKVFLTIGKLGETFPIPTFRSKRNENWQKNNSHLPEVSYPAVHNGVKDKTKKRKYPTPGLEDLISFSAGPIKELMFDRWRGQNPVTVYSQHLIPIDLPFCDDISQEGGTARSFLNPNHPLQLCERVSSPLERRKQTNECEGVSLPAPSLGGGWRGQAKPKDILQPHITPHSSSMWRLRQGFRCCITAFGREYLLEFPEKLLGEFTDKSNMKC